MSQSHRNYIDSFNIFRILSFPISILVKLLPHFQVVGENPFKVSTTIELQLSNISSIGQNTAQQTIKRNSAWTHLLEDSWARPKCPAFCHITINKQLSSRNWSWKSFRVSRPRKYSTYYSWNIWCLHLGGTIHCVAHSSTRRVSPTRGTYYLIKRSNLTERFHLKVTPTE